VIAFISSICFDLETPSQFPLTIGNATTFAEVRSPDLHFIMRHGLETIPSNQSEVLELGLPADITSFCPISKEISPSYSEMPIRPYNGIASKNRLFFHIQSALSLSLFLSLALSIITFSSRRRLCLSLSLSPQFNCRFNTTSFHTCIPAGLNHHDTRLETSRRTCSSSIGKSPPPLFSVVGHTT